MIWCAFAVLCLWVVAATGYLMISEPEPEIHVAEKSRLRTAYEDRISRLRNEIETINSKLMLNQDAFDAELATLRSRQARLEARQRQLDGLMDDANHPSVQGPAGAGSGKAADAEEATGSLGDAGERGAAVRRKGEIKLNFAPKEPDGDGAFQLASASAAPNAPTGAKAALHRLAATQDRLEEHQNETLAMLETRAASASKAFESILSDLGFDPDQLAAADADPAAQRSAASVGGPFVPVLLDSTDTRIGFERRIAKVRQQIALSSGLYDGLMTLPVRRPVDGDPTITSGFGTRRDPFNGSMAMHSGIDFRASSGQRVQSTAAGVVTLAGYNGGYGRMVEIRHDNGISTRYAHLSRISVREGQKVEAGQAIGRAGSSGRSTGPHLHYETRINGEAVDARRFIRAGDKFFDTLLN